MTVSEGHSPIQRKRGEASPHGVILEDLQGIHHNVSQLYDLSLHGEQLVPGGGQGT